MERSTPGAEPARRAPRRVWFVDDLSRVDAARSLWAPDEGDDDAARDALDLQVRAAVSEALTERQRVLVELHFFQGLSQGEIARQLGITQQVVQKQLYGVQRRGKLIGGALARLRDALLPVARERGFVRAEVERVEGAGRAAPA